MPSHQIFTDKDILVKLAQCLDVLSLLKWGQVNKQLSNLCNDSLINTWIKFEEYAKLYLTKHGMMDETIELMQDRNELKRCHTYISSAESKNETKPFILSETLKVYIDVMNAIIAASKTDKVMDRIMFSLVQEYDTFVSVSYPFKNDIPFSSSRRDLFSLLRQMVPIETFNPLVFGQNLDERKQYILFDLLEDNYELEKLTSVRNLASKIYLRLIEREAMRIVLNHPKVTKYNSVSYDAAGHSNKNLLLLDWDQTLYNREIARDGLHEFLISACKHFCVWIETGGYNRQEYITKLNKIDGINICGVISANNEKWRLNKWILENQWFGIDSKFENFLLIDDLWEQQASKHKFINTVIIPRVGIDRSDQHKIEHRGLDVNKVVQFLDFDKNVLSKLMQWLLQWNQYTKIKQRGSTSKFIQENGLPQLKFTLYDDDKWFFQQLLLTVDPNYKYKHLLKLK